MILSEQSLATRALVMSTIAFSVCFACWVTNAVLVTFLVSNGVFNFSDSQIGWLLAVPILTGALSRVPLGLLTDRIGGRRVFTVLLLATAVAMFLLSYADSYQQFLFASFAFGIAGGSFAVGVGFVSGWHDKKKQGTVLGIFGVGNAGAAVTTMLAPSLLIMFTSGATDLEGWRQLPQAYAGLLIFTAAAFYWLTQDRVIPNKKIKTLKQQLAPLSSVIVWRFGLYYFLVFGSFVALAQWIIPYSVNVYELTLTEAGLLASAFILPSGLIRAYGGWLSDRFGARTVMYGVFTSIIIACAILIVPRMDIATPGEGVSAKANGVVIAVSSEFIIVGDREYRLTSQPEQTAADFDTGFMVFPRVDNWHTPMVAVGDLIEKKQLLAEGTSHIYYPANLWLFVTLLFILGVATGVGKAAVFKFIPDQFPDSVGAVGGMVGLLGALGGFFFPPVWGYLLSLTGLWSSCWIILLGFAIACLAWMHIIVRRIFKEEAPELVQLIERRTATLLPNTIVVSETEHLDTIENALKRIPFLSDLSQEELKQLTHIGQYHKVAENETLFREHDPGDTLFVILEGRVRIYKTGNQGQSIEIIKLQAGDFFGELALIDGKPRSAAVESLTPSAFFLIGRRDFLTIMAKSPRLLTDVLIGMSTKIRRINEQFHDLALRDRLLAQSEIERHRTISQMVAGVAHEINTPLGIVNNAASLLSEELNEKQIPMLAKDNHAQSILSDVYDASKLIQSNILRASKLVNSFKNLSVNQINDEKQNVNLYELTSETVKLHRFKALDSKLEIVVINNLSTEERVWSGYPGLYAQVMDNLISNIERYAYPHGSGKVEIRLSEEPRENDSQARFVIEVHDFGAGIPAANLNRVFDPFFSTGRELGGTGLGLAIVYNLVTMALHGTIRIESDINEGTRVTMTIPQTINENRVDRLESNLSKAPIHEFEDA